MLLHCKHYPGEGPAVVVLHGLYGNGANWAPQARQLAQGFNVYIFDARNHGQSPWAETMSFSDMAQDVADTMASLGLQQAHLVGHSMGGKTAMWLALTQPMLVSSLCAVDIAPVAYPKADDVVVRALNSLNLAELSSRAAADAALAKFIATKFVRDFLLTNLQRDEANGWRWRFNLPRLMAAFREITSWPSESGTYVGEALFIKGELSDYVLPEHTAAMQAQFPHGKLKTINGAGHWVHSEKPEAVLRLLENFLRAER